MNTLKKTYNLFLVTYLLAVSGMSLAVENPNVGGTFQRSTNPTHSGQTQRFISQPGSNPYGQYGNDVMTGNVGGGKHFRGIVPYGSRYYSGAYSNSPGSRSVSNFVRRSQNPIVNDRNPGQTRSFYDPSRTVTTLSRPDGTSGLTPPVTTPQGRTSQFVIPNQAFTTPTPTVERPLSSNNLELEQLLARQEQLRQDAQLEQTVDEEDTTKTRNFFDIELLRKPKQDTQQDTTEVQEDEIESKISLEEQVFLDMQKQEAEAEAARESAQKETDEPKEEKADLFSPKSDLLPDLDSELLDAAGGKAILGEHATFNELAEQRFASYMDTADKYIQNKQFYKAADTFSLAMIWKPEDARAYLGKAFSLLSAGEYMSSAFYLSQAFELDSSVAEKKFDLAEFIGDRDIYENRELEIRTWLERSGSGELAFLLAYISHQDNKNVRAVESISKAKEAMPNSRAVLILDRLINPEPAIN